MGPATYRDIHPNIRSVAPIPLHDDAFSRTSALFPPLRSPLPPFPAFAGKPFSEFGTSSQPSSAHILDSEFLAQRPLYPDSLIHA